MKKKLQTKVAIVTGASNGIGRGIAELFAAEGAKTVLVARRTEVLNEVAAGIELRGGEALPAPTDLTQEEAVTALFATVKLAYRRLDVLVNNAGIATHMNTEDITLKYWREALDINITAAFLCSREADPYHEGADAAGAGVSSTSVAFLRRRHCRIFALHNDQIRPPGHDASADDGRTQAQHRRIDHPSGRDTMPLLVHNAPRPDQGWRRRKA